MNSYRKKQQDKNTIKKTIPALILLVCILIAGIWFLKFIDNRDARNLPVEATEEKDYVEIGGVKCRPKQNVETYLLLGTDIRGKMSEFEGIDFESGDGTGQADLIQLLIIDKTKDTYATLAINRNTIVEMGGYENGERMEVDDMVGQICLAYAYGEDGKEHSCENMADTVSKLLNGQKINGYMALGLDAIPSINHQLGGVTITIEHDFSNSCPTLIKGQTKQLTDEEAAHFCHDRMGMEGDESNESRMVRQKAFLAAAKPILYERCRSNEKFVLDFYDALGDYMYTNITKKQVSKIAKAALKNEDLGEFELEGEKTFDEDTGYDEFYVDPDNLAQIVIQLFYNPI